eukprot:GILJ01003136.1.p1 GENE.GILJ01003136.1~~GILJ01003136.1.p1  ORF type:complete len:868 (-),score=153.08 GILJ01003136.1:19-2622(-)
MSLFQAREWWSTRAGTDEEYDRGSVCVGNIDNAADNAQKVIVGSFQGVLRIYYPHSRDYRIEDLVLEQNLEQPILQLEVGRFVANSAKLALAILHPRKLAVYQVSSVGGQGTAVSYFELKIAYTHSLDRSAFNMTIGPFGGVSGKDFLCVQSVDGVLAFFEQESFAFSRFLPNFLLPGPLCYVSKSDSIVTCNAQMQVESYKYTVLAAAANNVDADEASKGHGKKIQVDWTTNIGEHALEIRVGRVCRSLSSTKVDIIVLGEKSMFCLKEQGSIRLQKRLDFFPSSCTSYNASSEDMGGASQHLIVGSHSSHLLVYKDVVVIWAAKLTVTPVAIRVANFGSVSGLVVVLDDSGHLQLCYMGTDPPTSSMINTDIKELNYDDMNAEHAKLLAVIKASQNDERKEPDHFVSLRAQVPTQLDASSEYDDAEVPLARTDSGQLVQVTVRLFVSYSGRNPLENVTVTLQPPFGIITPQTTFVVDRLAGQQTPLVLPISFQCRSDITPATLTVNAVAAYLSESGEPRSCLYSFQLPLSLVVKVIPPVKTANYKLTLETNRLPPSIVSLFEELMQQSGFASSYAQQAAAANVLTVQYHNGVDVTILISKNAGRYRIQSSVFEALWLITSELANRLQRLFDATVSNEEPFKATFQEPLPLQDFFVLIDHHFKCRMDLVTSSNALKDRAHQYRVIQKRLLIRFKDRNPTPLSNLDALMGVTYQQIMNTANEIQELQQHLRAAAHRLSTAVHLILLLMKLRFDMDEDSFAVLQSHLSPHVVDTLEQGWEEYTDAAMVNLLRSSLAKNVREQTAVPGNLVMSADTSKLIRHINIVCERLAKGAKLVVKSDKDGEPLGAGKTGRNKADNREKERQRSQK